MGEALENGLGVWLRVERHLVQLGNVVNALLDQRVAEIKKDRF